MNKEKSEETNKSRKVTIRFSVTEYEKLFNQFQKTTKRKLSQYLRSVLLEGKVTVYTRDQSLDELVVELIHLRRELSAFGNNYNQVVKRLYLIRDTGEIERWLTELKKEQDLYTEKVEAIQKKISQIAKQW
jgi:hypothetical protein